MASDGEHLILYKRVANEQVEVVDSWQKPVEFLDVLAAARETGLPPSRLFFDDNVRAEDLPVLYLGTSINHYIEIQLASSVANTESRPLGLTKVEFGIVATLARRPNVAVTRAQIIRATNILSEAAVTTHMSRVRGKLDSHKDLISAMSGFGQYMGVLEFDPADIPPD